MGDSRKGVNTGGAPRDAFGIERGDAAVGLCHFFLHHAVICAHHQHRAPVNAHVLRVCDAAQLRDQIFQHAKAAQRLAHQVPVPFAQEGRFSVKQSLSPSM